jgi:hypothetical protein
LAKKPTASAIGAGNHSSSLKKGNSYGYAFYSEADRRGQDSADPLARLFLAHPDIYSHASWEKANDFSRRRSGHTRATQSCQWQLCADAWPQILAWRQERSSEGSVPAGISAADIDAGAVRAQGTPAIHSICRELESAPGSPRN